MDRRKLFCIVILLFLSTGLTYAQASSASTTSAGGAGSSSYCTDLFSTNQTTVTNAFVGGAVGTSNPAVNIASLAALIVLMVLLCLAVVYGIGIGFGIRRLVEFAKTEYIESFFNLVMIVLIAGGMATTNALGTFFTNLAQLSGSQINTTSGSTQGAATRYTGICKNVAKNQILPESILFAVLLAVQIPYSILQYFSVTLQASSVPVVGNLLPDITFSPLGGLSLYYQLVIFEEMPLTIVIFMGFVTIFLFYIIYFLFPIFLYAGVFLRSFPWTRAAGGSLLALFISFYIIFPAIYYPFSASIQTSGSGSSSTSGNSTIVSGICGALGNATSSLSSSGSSSSGSSCPYLLDISYTKLWAFLQAAIPVFSGAGTPFITNLDTYIATIDYGVVSLLGLAIAIVISFDLLEALGDMLGSPSLTRDRILERVI